MPMRFLLVPTLCLASLTAAGVSAVHIPKLAEARPHVIDLMKSDAIALVINVPSDKSSTEDERKIRRETIRRGLPYMTTAAAARAAVEAIAVVSDSELTVCSLQEWHA